VKKPFAKKLRTKKGFSIMAVVVAIAIISIVSVATTTLMIRSVKIERENLVGMEVSLHAKNAVECFRFSNSQDEFFDLISKSGDFFRAEEDITLKKRGYTVIINADFNSGLLSFEAIDGEGERLLSLSYKKNLG